jgi:hypothetical protein
MRGANRNRAPSFWIALAAGDPHQSAFCGRPAAAPGRRAVERRDDARRPQARWCEPPAGFWFWSLPLMHFGVGIRRGRKPRFRELSWSHGTHAKPVAGLAEQQAKCLQEQRVHEPFVSTLCMSPIARMSPVSAAAVPSRSRSSYNVASTI